MANQSTQDWLRKFPLSAEGLPAAAGHKAHRRNSATLGHFRPCARGLISRRPAVGYVVNLIAQIGLGRQREAAQRNVAPNILEVGDARFVSEPGSRFRVILSLDSDPPSG